MCGIVGFLAPDQRWDQATLARATNTIAHRGPDAEGLFYQRESGIGLGHRRLSVLDLSPSANQPMWSHNRRYVAVFNGEIFNYQEVAKGLNEAFTTHSDTEVILEAFAKWGPEFINECNGFFALAIFDTQTEQLYIFRDRLGLKPVYYYLQDGSFAFASEIKALRALVPTQTTDHSAIHTFLHVGYVPAPLTIYKAIRKLPKGAYCVVQKGKMEIHPFWKPEAAMKVATIRDEANAKQTLKNLVVSSVQYRMISDVPLGTFLSGGVDSSLVTAVAQSLSVRPVKTFSIGFDFAQHDESPYAEAVAKQLGTEHYLFHVTQREALDLVANISDIFDEPFADPSAIPTYIVSSLARKYVTVALSGDGGDEFFLGYGMYTWARRLQNPLISAFRSVIAALLNASGSNRNVAAAGLINYPVHGNLAAHIFSQDQRYFSAAEIAELVKQQPQLYFNIVNGVARKLDSAEAQALFDINNYLPDDLLVKVDRASMQHGLEVRAPLLDYRIAEFALNLDESLKIRGGVAKYLLKQVLYDYLPQAMFQRPKWGFSIPLRIWLKADLRYLLDEQLHSSKVASAGLVNTEVVEKLKRDFFAGRDFLYNRLWALAMLHQWHERFAKQ